MGELEVVELGNAAKRRRLIYSGKNINIYYIYICMHTYKDRDVGEIKITHHK